MQKVYVAAIAAIIAVFGSGMVAVNNRTHEVKGIETIEDLTVSRTQGNIIVPDNIDDMISKSDLIVIGTTQSILESTPLIQRNAEGYVSVAISLTQFKIQRVLKGQPYGDTIAIG